jgi:trans-2,3-dihydro-3-hydroxyanthranilate isomerase
MQRRFATLDVFTDQRFAGNPLAVVLDAEGLDTTAMQAIAREFNHPETVFVAPPDNAAHRARLRIFTPARELPFAGHPTVGTAVLLMVRERADVGAEFVLEEKIGPVRCRLEASGAERGRVRFDAPQLPAEAGAPPADAAIATALGLAPADIGLGAFRVSCWSAGNPFVFVPVSGLAAIARCRPDPATFDPTFGALGVYVFCGETTAKGRDFHARMFAPQNGIPEDPATGSAVAAFPGVLAKFAKPGDGRRTVAIEQGYEMGRPSLMNLEIVTAGGRLSSVSIGGDAVLVTSGTIEA